MKKIIISLALLLTSIVVSAQTTVSHTVQRGETIESVAGKYGVSVDDLQQANPFTKEYFYAGMKLTIPQVHAPSQSTVTNEETPTKPNPLTVSQKNPFRKVKERSRKAPHPSNLDGSDFNSIGLIFGSDFTDLVGMSYGVQGQYFWDNGLGATLTVGANFGLEDDADVVFRVGPSYVYPLTSLFYVMGTACYTLTMADYDGNTGLVSGASFIPTLGISINKIRIGLNADLHWRNGGDFGAGAYLSVGYSF